MYLQLHGGGSGLVIGVPTALGASRLNRVFSFRNETERSAGADFGSDDSVERRTSRRLLSRAEGVSHRSDDRAAERATSVMVGFDAGFFLPIDFGLGESASGDEQRRERDFPHGTSTPWPPRLRACADLTAAAQLTKKPRLGHFPVALGGLRRHAQDLGRFFHAQTAEVSQLDDPAFAGVNLR
jgi:hypothetical protein